MKQWPPMQLWRTRAVLMSSTSSSVSLVSIDTEFKGRDGKKHDTTSSHQYHWCRCCCSNKVLHKNMLKWWQWHLEDGRGDEIGLRKKMYSTSHRDTAATWKQSIPAAVSSDLVGNPEVTFLTWQTERQTRKSNDLWVKKNASKIGSFTSIKQNLFVQLKISNLYQ